MRVKIFYCLCAVVGVGGCLRAAAPEEIRRALHDALWHGNAELVQSILAASPGLINQPGPDGWMPLQVASYGDHENIVRFLIENGADVNKPNWSGWTPLHWAYTEGIARMLLERGAHASKSGYDGITPLHMAFRRGNKDVARVLLEYGARTDARNADGKTPQQVACNKEMSGFLCMHRMRAAQLELMMGAHQRCGASSYLQNLGQPGLATLCGYIQKEDFSDEAVHEAHPTLMQRIMVHMQAFSALFYA